MSTAVDKNVSKSFAFVVTQERGFGLALIATIGVFGIAVFAVAQAIGSGRSLSTTVQLQPVPRAVFESATGLQVEPPQTFSRACSLPGPRPLVRRLHGLVKAECPLPVNEVVPGAEQPRILGANLVRLRAVPMSVPSPKQVALPPLAWIVFFSGREAVGDYFATIYDAYTGAPVLNLVVVWLGPKGPPAPPANPPSN